MTRKFHLALVALLIAVTLFGTLGTQAPTRAQGTTLKAIIRPDEGGNVAMYVKKFKEQTGIDVQVDFIGWDTIHDKTITTLAGGGGGYDIIFVPSANVVEFTSGGWFEPIDDLITDKTRADWLEAVVKMYTIDGKLLAMPWYAGGAHMAYNKDVLDKAGVDPKSIKTWTDFMAACDKIAKAKAADFCFTPSAKYPGEWYYNWGTMVASLGGEFFDKDGAPIFQKNGEALAAMKVIKDGVDKGYFDKAGVAMDDYETLIAFGKGSVAFLLDSTWSVTQASVNKELSKITGKAGLILIPGSDKVRSGGYLYAGGLGILKSSKNKDAAKQFLTLLTSEEAQKHHAIEGSNMPTRLALYKDKDIAAKWAGFETLAEQLTYGKFPPQFGWFEEWRRSVAQATQDVMAGKKSPEDAIKFLADEAVRLKAK